MSQQNSPAKSSHESSEMYFKTLEIDTSCTDTTNGKTNQSGTWTGSDHKLQEFEIQRFLDEVDRKCSREQIEQLETALDEANNKIESLLEQIAEMEEGNQAEKKQHDVYFQTMDMLEKENDRLREENERLNGDIASIKKSLYVAEKQIEATKQISQTRKSRRDNNRDFSKDRLEAKQMKAGLLKNFQGSSIREMDSICEGNSSFEDEVSRASNTSCERSRLSFYVDDSWIKKLKFLKEKLINERKKNKNLQFLVDAQKNIAENANQTISKLKAETQSLEVKQEKLKTEFEQLTEVRNKDKSRIDNVITFCDLISNCSFSRDEVIDKLNELPNAISNFLKGSSDTINLKNSDISPTYPVTSLKHQRPLDEMSAQDRKTEEMAQELDRIRKTLSGVAQFLSQVFPNTDPSVLTNLETLSRFKMNLKAMNSESLGILHPRLANNEGSVSGSSNRKIFAKAILNSSSLLWNLKMGNKGNAAGGGSEEVGNYQNQENIDFNKM